MQPVEFYNHVNQLQITTIFISTDLILELVQ